MSEQGGLSGDAMDAGLHILPTQVVTAEHAPVTALPEGRRMVEIRVGSLLIRVLEVPGSVVSDEEWASIQQARQSYVAMWGGERVAQGIQEDEFDGRLPGCLWETHHYLARAIARDGRCKLLTMRKVSFAARVEGATSEYPVDSLPDDIRFWRLRNAVTGQQVPLWDALREHLRRIEPTSTPQSRRVKVSCLGRSATYPLGPSGPDVIDRDSSAIACAAIQLLVTCGHDDQIYVGQVCPEFQEQAFGMRDMHGARVMLDFQKTAHTLQLPLEQRLELDNDRSYVYGHKVQFPGYWIENNGAFRVLRTLVDEGKLTSRDLDTAWQALLTEGQAARHPELVTCHDPVLRLQYLTRPRYFKHLTPLINTDDMINPILSGHEVRHRLVHDAGDGPFSSTIPPDVWRRSALALLAAAQTKYRSEER